jgi:SAM-dependent methyltransferase
MGSAEADPQAGGRTALRAHLSEVILRFPAPLQPSLRAQLPRVLFEAGLVGHAPQAPGGARLVDLGAGLSLLPLACAHLGWQVTCVDDLHVDYAGYAFEVHRALGLAVEQADLLSWNPPPATGLHAAVCIDVLEHLHHSPRPLLTRVAAALAPGGRLVLGAPNAVNLRKRLAVPLGVSAWSRLPDWWQPDRFHGHVREPTLPELRWMAQAVGLEVEAVYGRSFAGLSQGGLAGLAARVLELPLRALPQLASDLYLVAQRPAASSS